MRRPAQLGVIRFQWPAQASLNSRNPPFQFSIRTKRIEKKFQLPERNEKDALQGQEGSSRESGGRVPPKLHRARPNRPADPVCRPPSGLQSVRRAGVARLSAAGHTRDACYRADVQCCYICPPPLAAASCHRRLCSVSPPCPVRVRSESARSGGGADAPLIRGCCRFGRARCNPVPAPPPPAGADGSLAWLPVP